MLLIHDNQLYEARKRALELSHDYATKLIECRGAISAEDVVARAKVYEEFLTDDQIEAPIVES